jgi:hypothetical protein
MLVVVLLLLLLLLLGCRRQNAVCLPLSPGSSGIVYFRG